MNSSTMTGSHYRRFDGKPFNGLDDHLTNLYCKSVRRNTFNAINQWHVVNVLSEDQDSIGERCQTQLGNRTLMSVVGARRSIVESFSFSSMHI